MKPLLIQNAHIKLLHFPLLIPSVGHCEIHTMENEGQSPISPGQGFNLGSAAIVFESGAYVSFAL